MKISSYFFLIVFLMSISFPFHAHALKRAECDRLEQTTSRDGDGMISRDTAVNKWAECWEHSLNSDLDERLLPLKKSDKAEFSIEMELQKLFKTALIEICSRNCESGGSGMKGISYNFCRVEGYRYRTAQAIAASKNEMTIPSGESLGKKTTKQKERQTKYFKSFVQKLCQLPKNIWKDQKIPEECEKKANAELDSLELTDDVCDLN